MQKYGRYIGIDVGTKRVGLARTDLLRISINPNGTFSRNNVFGKLEEEVEQSNILAFIVGWPLDPDGKEDAMTKKVQTFINELKRKFPDIPVNKVDERYTSKEAVQHLIEAGVPKMKRRKKERIDETAAAIILQKYLEMKSTM